MSKKVIFYLKGVQRAIAITDPHDEQSLEECSSAFENALQTNNVFTASNGRDILILKPSDVAAIHITQLEKTTNTHNHQYESTKELISDENVADMMVNDSPIGSRNDTNVLDLSELLDGFNDDAEENENADEGDDNSYTYNNNENISDTNTNEKYITPNQNITDGVELDTAGLNINIHEEINNNNDDDDDETNCATKNEKIHTIQDNKDTSPPKVLKIDTATEKSNNKKKNIKKE
jgi:hypothetical protein